MFASALVPLSASPISLPVSGGWMTPPPAPRLPPREDRDPGRPVRPSADLDGRLAELLASRLCHDLSGPIGVAADAEDLVGTAETGLDPDGVALVAESAQLAAARLAFFRAAFGGGAGPDRSVAVSTLAELAGAALASPRRRISFAAAGAVDGAALPGPLARLCLCLVLMATEALPRGGLITVGLGDREAGVPLTVVAEGAGAQLAEPLLAALAADSRALTARTVVGYYARTLADRLALTLRVTSEGDRLCFALGDGPALPGMAAR